MIKSKRYIKLVDVLKSKIENDESLTTIILMTKKYLKIVFLISCFALLLSCNEVIKKSHEIITEAPKEELVGKYFPLEGEGIRIFLPKEFKKLSKSDYFALLRKSPDTAQLEREEMRFRNIENSNFDIYLFEYFETGSVMSAVTVDYIELNKGLAQALLNQLKVQNDQQAEITGFTHTKIEARYFETSDAKIFKAIFQLENQKTKDAGFKQIYLVSFNNKTFFLSLETPFLVDFDPYLEKIRVL